MAARQLTNTYRPQTFSEVVGQAMVCRILSRAAKEGRLAPAYLFSGTRGVGKTTVARILAKAINCEHGPASEPCNNCRHCQEITRGSCVDVVEIDGASHTGVDHVRKLKEDLGYAPLSCRFKVIVIDEAHMLSNQAFNALLKTLEEPPPQAVFIMATTEAHRFPATILSRCQQHIFHRLTQKEIKGHLGSILDLEGVEFEDQVLRLLTRKARGSVRDAMSLLAQVLALGQGCITAEQVREVLGLASQETMFALFEALRDQDCVGINTVLRKVTDQGLDLAFFLRELSSTWRNLFLLKQAGDKAFELLDLSSEEARQWTKWAESFSAAHIHACWQMTLEGQRRVLTSVEPVLALELLALNLAFLPDLLPVGQLSRPKTGSGPGPGGSGPHPASGDRPEPTDQAPQSEEADGTPGAESKTWAGFVRFCRQKAEGGEKVALEVSRLEGEVLGQVLWLKCPSEVQSQLLAGPEKKSSLQVLASQYFETSMQIEVCGPGSSAEQGQDGLKEEALRHPAIQEAFSSFQAQLVNVVARTNRQVT